MDDTNRCSVAFRKEDCRKLQVLQNKTLRLKTRNYTLNVPTSELLEASGALSVHQLGAYHTLVTVFKLAKSGQPQTLARKLVLQKPEEERILTRNQVHNINVDCRLSISRSGFVYRGAKLWNNLPLDLRQENKIEVFPATLFV